MQGITPYVDLQATLINTKPSKFTKNWRLWPSTAKGKDRWLIDWNAFNQPSSLLENYAGCKRYLSAASDHHTDLNTPSTLTMTLALTMPAMAPKQTPSTFFGNVNNGHTSEILIYTNCTCTKARLAHKQNESKPLILWYACHASSNAAFAQEMIPCCAPRTAYLTVMMLNTNSSPSIAAWQESCTQQ